MAVRLPVGAFDSPAGWWNYITLTLYRRDMPAPWRDQYRMLRAYYLNNGLYEILSELLRASGLKDIKPIRNPAYRVVEFYASKLWPGKLPAALPIVAENEAIIEPIQQIWEWSNWSNEKQTAVRWFATTGDLFIKCATNVSGRRPEATRVYMQNIDPEVVTDFSKDERGYLTMIRLDIPQVEEDEAGQAHPITYTEVWDKDLQLMRIWKHRQAEGTSLRDLGEPVRQVPFSAFGIDFVPFVWQPFRSIGDERGLGAFTAQLEKIDNINREATRLAHMLFRHNRALWALKANQVDKMGRPLPPPSFEGLAEGLEYDDDDIIGLPGMSELQALVAPINYADALAVLESDMRELEADLPELAYYRLREMSQVSGRAVQAMLGDAQDRLVEARGNAEAALVRAHQMCLTLGLNAGLFSGLNGTYEDGSFRHDFMERPIFGPDEFEVAQTVHTYAQAGIPVMTAARMAGWSDEQIAALEQDRAEEDRRSADMAQQMVDQARRGFDQEGANADDDTEAP